MSQAGKGQGVVGSEIPTPSQIPHSNPQKDDNSVQKEYTLSLFRIDDD
jgi:hypothetical protein